LEEVIRLVESHDAYLLMDETYRELSFEDPPPRAATLSPRAISITSLSKVYRVPGIRIGWVAADESIIESVRAVREQITICNSVVGERIAFEILKRKEELLAQTRDLVQTNYQIVEGWLDGRSDVEWVPPRGGVVAFPRLVEDVPADDLCRLLVEKYRTFVVPGYCFQIDRHFRLGFGGNPEELKAGLECLDKALEEWRGFPRRDNCKPPLRRRPFDCLSKASFYEQVE
jgi:aspartate/methionine/tyrosine aminotransferase